MIMTGQYITTAQSMLSTFLPGIRDPLTKLHLGGTSLAQKRRVITGRGSEISDASWHLSMALTDGK